MSSGKRHGGSELPNEGPRIVNVSEGSDSDLSASETSSDEDRTSEPAKDTNFPPEYWQIQKLIKYMKAGNQTATVVALSCLKDYDLTADMCQQAVQDTGGLDALVNLLETKDEKCKMGALAALEELTQNFDVRKRVTDLGAVPLLTGILSDPNERLRAAAAETIANLGKIRKARKLVRKHRGIPKLIDLLDVSELCLTSSRSTLSEDECIKVDLARAGTRALWAMSTSKRNRETMRKHGVVALFSRLLKTVHSDVCVPTVGALQQCASEPSFRLAVQTEGMIADIVRHLAGNDDELKMYCSMVIYKCAVNEETREAVRTAGGLELLVTAAVEAGSSDKINPQLVSALTGALWKCSAGMTDPKLLNALGAVDALVALLNSKCDEVLTNVVGALAECAKSPINREKLRELEGIPLLIQHLNSSHEPLLKNVPLVLMECAKERESMNQIENLDGVRLIWSLLKNESPEVRANACLALCPCVENSANSGEQVRSFVGGLELIVSLLTSLDDTVTAAVCAAIATVAKDRENLAIISDHGVVAKLARLVYTSNDELRRGLAEAIAYCCEWTGNREEFGRLGAIEPLVGYLTSQDLKVHRSTALALYHLSFHPSNCVTMHQAGVVKFLLETVGSTDEELQEASAGCLCNIRKLALDPDKAKICR